MLACNSVNNCSGNIIGNWMEAFVCLCACVCVCSSFTGNKSPLLGEKQDLFSKSIEISLEMACMIWKIERGKLYVINEPK